MCEGIGIALTTPIPPPVTYDSQNRVFFIPGSQRRDNKYWRRSRAKRYAKQIEEEGIETYGLVAEEGWAMYRQGLIRAGTKYKSFPQERVIVAISEKGNRELPKGEGLVEQIDEWIAGMPEKKAMGGTQGFGGKWSGSKKKPEKWRYLRLPIHWDLGTVREALRAEGVETAFEDGRLVIPGINHRKVQETLEKVFQFAPK